MNELDQIIALTDAIEACVAEGDWAEASALDLERRDLLTAIMTADVSGLLASGAREILKDLLARNSGTVAAIKSARQQLDGEARQLRAAPAAMRSYQQNAAIETAGSEAP